MQFRVAHDEAEQDVLQRQCVERFESGEWWLLIPVGDAGAAVVEEIEHRHYSSDPDSGAGFEVVTGGVGPAGLLTSAFAHKKWMSAAELAALCYQLAPETGDFSPAVLERRDIVMIGRTDETGMAHIAATLAMIGLDGEGGA